MYKNKREKLQNTIDEYLDYGKQMNASNYR